MTYNNPQQNYGNDYGASGYGETTPSYNAPGASPSPYGAFPNSPQHNELAAGSTAPGAWVRFFAYFVDGLVMIPFGLILAIPTLFPAFMELGEAAEVDPNASIPWQVTLGFGALMAVVWFIYRVLMETKFQGSLGKKALGLRVVGENGGNLSAKDSFIRNSWYLLTLIPVVSAIIQIVLGVMIARDPEKRHAFDKAGHARVIRK